MQIIPAFVIFWYTFNFPFFFLLFWGKVEEKSKTPKRIMFWKYFEDSLFRKEVKETAEVSLL